MKTLIKYTLLAAFLLTIFSASNLMAKTPVSDDGNEDPSDTIPTEQVSPAPVKQRGNNNGTGEDTARKYFNKKQKTETQKESDAIRPDEHYLAIHIGGFLSSDAYQWGATPHVSNPGRLQGGLTYRLDELGKFADWAIRADFIGYQLPEGNALNFSILPMILFPEAGSAFPLYFGVGIGPGVFFSQIGNESTLSLNYELVGGVRVFNVVENCGFFAETGLKNEVHLLSDGQFNGFFLSVGALFVF